MTINFSRKKDRLKSKFELIVKLGVNSRDSFKKNHLNEATVVQLDIWINLGDNMRICHLQKLRLPLLDIGQSQSMEKCVNKCKNKSMFAGSIHG